MIALRESLLMQLSPVRVMGERAYVRRVYLALIFVTLAGLGLRLYNIDYGLPFFYGPPEIEAIRTDFAVISPSGSDELQFVRATIRLLQERTLNPAYFAQPGTPLMYMGTVLFGGMFGTGIISGVYPDMAAARWVFNYEPAPFYLAYRMLVALIGTASIPLVALIGRRVVGARAGLIAALIFALSPLHVLLSKVIRADTLMVFMLLAAFWFCLDIIKRGTWRAYLLAGFFVGLAVVSKYPAAVFVAVIFVACWLDARRDFRKLVASGAACVLGVFVGSPYALLDFSGVLAAVSQEAEIHLGGGSEGLLLDMIWYLRVVLPNGVSLVGVALAAVGAVLIWRSGSAAKRLLLVFPPVFLVFICTLGIRWERWLVPVIPFVALWIGHAAVVIAARVGRWRQGGRLVALAALVLMMSLPLLYLDMKFGWYIGQPETRTIARQWMIDNIPPGSRILIERHGPQPPKDLFRYYEERREEIIAVDADARPYRDLYAYGELARLADLDAIAEWDIDYLVLSDYYDQYLAEAHLYPERVAQYEALHALGEVVYEIRAVPGQTAGPHLMIVRVG